MLSPFRRSHLCIKRELTHLSVTAPVIGKADDRLQYADVWNAASSLRPLFVPPR
jgi:hypothetical protein